MPLHEIQYKQQGANYTTQLDYRSFYSHCFCPYVFVVYWKLISCLKEGIKDSVTLYSAQGNLLQYRFIFATNTHLFVISPPSSQASVWCWVV